MSSMNVPSWIAHYVTGDIHGFPMDTDLYPWMAQQLRMSTDCPWTHTYTHTYMYPRVLVSVDGTVTGDVHGLSMDTHLYPNSKVTGEIISEFLLRFLSTYRHFCGWCQNLLGCSLNCLKRLIRISQFL